MSRLPGKQGSGGDPPVLRFDGRRLVPGDHAPVEEVPITLTVNGVELATLIASPHDPHHLVAGFLRMQELIRSPGDLLTLSVCRDFGAASVRIRGEVPARLKTTLTSGCGAGVSFHVPGAAGRPVQIPSAGPFYPPEALFSAMEALARAAESYRDSGGIHSAAVSDGERILLHAEDIGRHNAVDRIAGEALLRGIDLSGRILVTSGRVSSEMAVKAASLGISVIASRTSPAWSGARPRIRSRKPARRSIWPFMLARRSSMRCWIRVVRSSWIFCHWASVRTARIRSCVPIRIVWGRVGAR